MDFNTKPSVSPQTLVWEPVYGRAMGCGYEGRTTHTRFGGIFVGYEGAYAGLNLSDYRHRRNIPEEAVARYDRFIPGLALGYVGALRGNSKPIMEISLYRFPGEVVFTLGMGVQILLGE